MLTICNMTKLALKKALLKIFLLYTTILCEYFAVIAFLATFAAFIIGSGLRLHMQQRNIDMEYLYVPLHANAKYEFATIQEHWPITGNQFVIGRSFNHRRASQAVFRYKDGSSLMNLDTMAVLAEWNNYIIRDLNGTNEYKRPFYFPDLCLTWFHQCSFTNQHLNTIKIMLERNLTTDITYPKWQIYGFMPLYIGTLIGGMELYNGTDKVKLFTSILLIYYLDYLDPMLEHPRLDWEKRFAESIERSFIKNESSPFDVSYLHSKSLGNGLTEVPALAASRLILTIIILIAFSVINCCRLCLRSGRIRLDLNGSKPLLGLAGITTSVYGVVTAIGIYLYSGSESNGIFIVIPFLTLAIGLDDTFIMLAAWHQTDRGLPISVRLSGSVANSVHSITITSITSCLSFVIGMLSQLPAVKMFCEATAMAIFCNYIYQVTFFPALLYVSGLVEVHGMQRVLYFLDLPFEIKKEELSTIKQEDGAREDPIAVLIQKYCRKFLQPTSAKVLTLLLYITYITPAFYGITQLKQGLKVHRLVRREHHVAKFFQTYWSNFYEEGQQAEIVINNAPNLTHSSERRKLEALLNHIEGSQYTMNSETTEFFLRDYQHYLRVHKLRSDDDPKVWQSGLYDWSTTNVYRKAAYPDMFWEVSREEAKACRNCDRVLKAFRFRVGLLNFVTTDSQRAVAKFIRSQSDKYPEYNITTYNAEWPFVDQYNIIVPNTLVTLSTAVASMAVVAAVFFRDLFCIVWTVLSIISINIGVIGYMALWGVHLECASMMCIIMSIGLSVDYTAHVVHGFRIATGTIDNRILKSLKSLGLPILQGGFSTLLGVLTIFTVHAYRVQVFFKVTTLAVCFGLLHACTFIPVALSTSAHLLERFCHRGITTTIRPRAAQKKPQM